MSAENIYEIAVVGSGAAGSMGALRAVLNNLDTLCFLGNAKSKKKARATWVGKVENMPVLFDKPKAVFQSANEVFKWIKSQSQWSEKLTEVKDAVVEITGSRGDFELKDSSGKKYRARYVLLCTGIMDVQPLINGSIDEVFPMANEGHIEYCIRCDGHKSKGKDTVIIGHTESAAWIASLLFERYKTPSMTILSNGHELEIGENPELKKRLHCYGIEYDQSAIVEIFGEPKKEGLKGFRLESGKAVEAQIAYVSLGTIVYNELAKKLGCNIDERGYVPTDESGESSVPGIFIGGDLRADKKKQIYTAWDITVDSVDKIDRYVRDERRARDYPDCQEKNSVEKFGDLFGNIMLPEDMQRKRF